MAQPNNEERFPYVSTLLILAGALLLTYVGPYLFQDSVSLLHVIEEVIPDLSQPDPEYRTG